MQSIQFKFCSFRDNLIQKVLQEQPADQTLFIFPTETSLGRTIREFQAHWHFEKTGFLTMENFKELVFYSDRPLLKEDRRILALYSALDEKNKHFFRIGSYFQAVELAHHFFTLWEEFNEEVVSDDIDTEKFALNNAEMPEWQQQTWQQLLNLKSSYRDYIARKGFEDIIYLYQPDRINLKQIQEFERIVFVNQFYYTGLEKLLIRQLQAQDKSVIIYYQLHPELVDQVSLEVKPFTLQDFHDFRTEQIQIIDCQNDFTTMVALIKQIHQQTVHNIVDVNFFSSPYARFLSPTRFSLAGSRRFADSSLFRFFQTLQNLLDAIIWEPTRRKFLLPLQTLLESVLVADFYHYFVQDTSAAARKDRQDQSLFILYDLLDYDYKYIDLDDELFKTIKTKPGKAELEKIIDILVTFSHIRTIADLITLVDNPIGIRIKHAISASERDHTELLDGFYRKLSDFSAIEAIGLIDDWAPLFTSSDPHLRGIKIAAGIVRLYIDYLKPATFRIHYKFNHSARIEITELLNTRNLNYMDVAVLKLIEGKIPSERQIPFLFTEKQRKLLNLKTYEDIRQREKYYFLRLVLTTPRVFLFTQKNIEKNVQVSSFVEELKLFFPAPQIAITQDSDFSYREIYHQFFQSDANFKIDPEQTRTPAFFALALEPERDFSQNRVDLTYYETEILKNNPFVFYLQSLAGVRELTRQAALEFSPRLIGNIVHDILNEAWHYLIQEYAGPLFGYDFTVINTEFIARAVTRALQRPDFYFRIPHNHTAVYFNEILLPVIIAGVTEFFHFLDRLHLSHKTLKVIPEKTFVTASEPEYKTLFQANENPLGIKIRIRGRADLRIEVPEERRFYIFDYKTGKAEKEQLIFYELFYYLLEKPELWSNVSSYLFKVLTHEVDELRESGSSRKWSGGKEELIRKYQEEIVLALADLKDRGFSLPDKKTAMSTMAEISRKDLFLTQVHMYER